MLHKAISMYPTTSVPLHNMGVPSELKPRWEAGVTGSQSVYYYQAEGCDKHQKNKPSMCNHICHDYHGISLPSCYCLTKKWWSWKLWQKDMNSYHPDCPHFQPPTMADTTSPIMALQANSTGEQRKAEDVIAAIVAGQQGQPMEEQSTSLLPLFGLVLLELFLFFCQELLTCTTPELWFQIAGTKGLLHSIPSPNGLNPELPMGLENEQWTYLWLLISLPSPDVAYK